MSLHASGKNNGNSATPTVAWVAVSANDYVLLKLGFGNNTVNTSTKVPSGFTWLDGSTTFGTFVGDSSFQICYKIATGSESGTVTWPDFGVGACDFVAEIETFSGRDPALVPVSGGLTVNIGANTSVVTAAAPGVTAATQDDLSVGGIFDWAAGPTAAVTWGPNSGYSVTQEFSTSGGGFTPPFFSHRKENVSSGSTGTISTTGTFTGGSNVRWGAILVRLPAALNTIDVTSANLTLTGQGEDLDFNTFWTEGVLTFSGQNQSIDISIVLNVTNGNLTLTGGTEAITVSTTVPAVNLGGVIITPAKKLSENSYPPFDFISWLATGETITTASCVCSVYSGVDATPSAMLSGSATIQRSRVTQLVINGILGNIYQVLCNVTTSTGRNLTQTTYIAVVPD